MHQQLTQTPGLAYSTFVRRLPYKPLATNDFHRGVQPVMPNTALGMRNIAPDRPYEVSWLKFDLDFSESAAMWIDEDMPPPHFIVVNPANAHSHYLYALEKPVVSSDNARRGPLEYLNAITLGYSKVLQADTAYPGKFCKTPTHPAWQTHIYNGPLYALETLASALPPSLSTKKVPRTEAVGLGRNVTLFDDLRQWAYVQAPAARSRGNYAAWQAAVRQQADRLNAFGLPLPQSEVRATANSVTKWTWKNAHNFSASVLGGTKRSKVRSENRTEISPKEAQRRMVEGADYTNLIRRNKTFDAITSALARLIAMGISQPSIRQIAEAAKRSESSVERYRKAMRVSSPYN